jgi:hypothetical protein
MAQRPGAGTLPGMHTPHRSSRVLLVASGRTEAEVGQVPVRRFRLARVRVNSPEAAAAPRMASGKPS